MTPTLQVLVLDPAEGGRYAPTLIQQGFQAQACTSLIDLYRCYDDTRVGLLLLAGSLDAAYMASARMRALDPGLGIVVVGDFTSSDQRVRAMQCGADICLPSDVDGMEIGASLQALVRRAAPVGEAASRAAQSARARDAVQARPPVQADQPDLPARPAPGGLAAEAARTEGEPAADPVAAGPGAGLHQAWHLQDSGWTLASPLGSRLRLTTSERAFLSRLLAAPGRRLSRGDLIASLGKVARPGAGAHGDDLGGVSASLRGVDVMVCRLRRKAEKQGIALPLRAVYRWGYMFVEEP